MSSFPILPTPWLTGAISGERNHIQRETTRRHWKDPWSILGGEELLVMAQEQIQGLIPPAGWRASCRRKVLNVILPLRPICLFSDISQVASVSTPRGKFPSNSTQVWKIVRGRQSTDPLAPWHLFSTRSCGTSRRFMDDYISYDSASGIALLLLLIAGHPTNDSLNIFYIPILIPIKSSDAQHDRCLLGDEPSWTEMLSSPHLRPDCIAVSHRYTPGKRSWTLSSRW